jgi:quercetin dioxygenase-like cupin family protein
MIFRFRTSAILLLNLCLVAGLTFVSHAQVASGEVERSGLHADLKIEQLITGNLTELNGKYKLRVAAVTYELGGFVGNHHHAGPGLRCVYEGTLTYVQEGVTNYYGPGDCFYESGKVDHHATNEGTVPVRLFNFQILPKDWTGSSAITVTPVE